MEPKIGQPHHNFTAGSEASRTCIQFREIWGAEEPPTPLSICTSQKTIQMQDVRCVYKCVCQGLKELIDMRCSLTFGGKQSNWVMAFPVLTRMEKPLESDGIHPLIPYYDGTRSPLL